MNKNPNAPVEAPASVRPSSDLPSLPYTYFDRLKGPDAAQGHLQEPVSWACFAEMHATPCEEFPETGLVFKKGSTTEYEKPAELGGCSPVVFEGDYRNAHNVKAVHAFLADIDAGLTSEQIDERLEGLASFRHSTFNHREGAERYRIGILLSRSVSKAEHAALFEVMQEQFSGCLDTQAADASRFWFSPAVIVGRTYAFRSFEGVPLDVENALRLVPAKAPEAAPSGVQLASAHVPVTKDEREAAGQVLGRNWPAPGEGRHRAQRALSGWLKREGWPAEDALEFLCDVCRIAGDEDRPKRTATVRDTYECEKPEGWASLKEALGPRGYAADTARGLLTFQVRPFDLSKRTEAEPPASSSPRPCAADRALSLGERMVRLETGFPTLDRATRGGLPIGKTVVLGGAPGAGKTTAAVQLAFRWLLQGVHVGILAADEDANGLLVRLGQLVGLDRTKIEEGDPSTVAKLSEWCRSVPLLLWDQDEDRMTLEEASAELAKSAAGAPSVIIADSIQSIRTARTTEAKDTRQRVDAVVGAMKDAAKIGRHLVIATSELARGAYRNQQSADDTNPLAAFKESGGIEYGFGLALVLRSRKGTNDLVDVAVAKNRFGGEKPPMLLRLNFDRAAVTEDTLLPAQCFADPLRGVKERIMALDDGLYLIASKTKNDVAKRVGGRRAVALRAVDALIEGGRLFQDERGVRYPQPVDHPPQRA